MKKNHSGSGKSQTADTQKPVNIYHVKDADVERRNHKEREERHQARVKRQIESSLGGESPRQRTERIAAVHAQEAEKSAMIRELMENSEPLAMEETIPSVRDTAASEPTQLPESELPKVNVSVDTLPDEEIAELSNILTPVSFTESLEKLTPDTIAPLPEKEKVPFSEKIREILRKLMLFGCLCVFGYSVFMLAQNIIDKQRGQDIYGDISSSIFESDLTTHAVSLMSESRSSVGLPDYYTALNADADELAEYAEPKAYNQTFERMKSNIAALTAQNSDTFGYIRIDGTNISYPVMQSSDNEYYLDHAYTGDPLIIGAIFADFRAYRYMDWNYNTVFYGHNIIDGSMFNNVTLFFDKEVFNSKLIEIYTPDAIYYYKPFAIFQAQATYQYFEMYFATGEDFVNFCYEMQERSTINNHETFTEDDRIITLSTCVNDPAGLYRYALQAKLVKIEN